MTVKTVRVRRNRPSALAVALSLMFTMLFVYAAARSATPNRAKTVSAQAQTQQEIHLDALTSRFFVYAWAQDAFAARAEAANCVSSGGAGWILQQDGRYAVICDMAQTLDAEENGEHLLTRSAKGCKLQISGSILQVNATADGARLLRAMATETASLASAYEKSGDASGVRALLGVYKTQLDDVCAALKDTDNAAARLIYEAALRASLRIDSAFSALSASKIRLFHTAANAEWISLMDGISAL